MTSPREQAIEEAAKAAYPLVRAESNCDVDAEKDCRECSTIATKLVRAAIDAYESARARLDGANTCPRCHGTGDDPKTTLRRRVVCSDCRGNGYRATPKEGT